MRLFFMGLAAAVFTAPGRLIDFLSAPTDPLLDLLVRRPLAFALGVFIAFFVMTSGAFAAVDGSIAVQALMDIVLPYVVVLIGSAVPIVGAWFFFLVEKILKLRVDAGHREAFQTALQNGSNKMLNKMAGKLDGLEFKVGNPIAEIGIEYVLKSAPGAIKHFKLSPQDIAEKLEAKSYVLYPTVEADPVPAPSPAPAAGIAKVPVGDPWNGFRA